MDRRSFHSLCHMLRVVGQLEPSRNMGVEEMVAIFLHILSHDVKNRIIKRQFMRSGETSSRRFAYVLHAILRCYRELLKEPEPIQENCTDERWKWFKNCLGALDGTYIKVNVLEADKPRYRTRKGELATNVLGVCSKDMQFIYVLAGWEGSAADSRVLRDAFSRRNGLKVPQVNRTIRSHKENDLNDKPNPVELPTATPEDESPSHVISKDLLSLPRPLSSTRLSDTVSDGSRLRVAYQGVRGAYSESAAQKAYPNCEAVPCDQFDTAFEAVERWLVDRAVLPIENSLGGSIHRNYDLLLRHRLQIVGELKYAVHHCLMANHGVKLEDLKRVLSHPQALAQCENTLTKLGLVREAVDDTAGAAKHIAFQKTQDAGAVASSDAAKIYGLNILAQDIQDDSDNVTRFLMLAREPIIPGTDRPFKTSIVFSLEEGPGVLFKALAVFALRQINLTKIESRPLRKQPLRVSDDNNNVKYFDYHFYVDFEASMADQSAQNALRHLNEFATFLRVLGSYPMDTST